ncbi:unnamed protein product [Rhizopus stolonifer]
METLFPEDLLIENDAIESYFSLSQLDFEFQQPQHIEEPLDSIYASFDDILSTQPKNNQPPFDWLNSQEKIPIQRHNAPKKTAHNVIERRYRNNINDRMTELKNAVPALLCSKTNSDQLMDGVPIATKLNKATILKKSTEYIQHLKKTSVQLHQENQLLQNMLCQLEGGKEVLRQFLMQRPKSNIYEPNRHESNRYKRSRYETNRHDSEDEHGPVTPPRVFMAMFMALSLFSTSPLTTSAKDDDNHQHVSRSLAENSTHQTTTESSFRFDSTWSALRTCAFVACLFHLFWPFLKSYLPSIKLKKRRKLKREPTLGELKCREMYTLLSYSLPDNVLWTVLLILKESLCLLLVYSGFRLTHRDLYHWIKLSEILSIYPTSRLLQAYATLKSLCLAHHTPHAARAQATAALQFPLLTRCLWIKPSNEPWMRSLSWVDPEQTHGSIDNIPSTRAWAETREVLGGKLSYHTLVPVQILSSFHLFEVLALQFERLMFEEETNLQTVMYLTQVGDQRLPHWLATVGVVVEHLWKDQAVNEWLPSLCERVPRSITADDDELDEDLKRTMIHTLVGSTMLRSSDVEIQKQGIEKLKCGFGERPTMVGLESQVMQLAEFLVAYVGLEAWTRAIPLDPMAANYIKERAGLLRKALRHSMGDTSWIDRRLREIKKFVDLPSGEENLVERAKRAQAILHN